MFPALKERVLLSIPVGWVRPSKTLYAGIDLYQRHHRPPPSHALLAALGGHGSADLDEIFQSRPPKAPSAHADKSRSFLAQPLRAPPRPTHIRGTLATLGTTDPQISYLWPSRGAGCVDLDEIFQSRPLNAVSEHFTKQRAHHRRLVPVRPTARRPGCYTCSATCTPPHAAFTGRKTWRGA